MTSNSNTHQTALAATAGNSIDNSVPDSPLTGIGLWVKKRFYNTVRIGNNADENGEHYLYFGDFFLSLENPDTNQAMTLSYLTGGKWIVLLEEKETAIRVYLRHFIQANELPIYPAGESFEQEQKRLNDEINTWEGVKI